MLGLPKVGRMVADHREGLGMSRGAKTWAIGSIVCFSGLSAALLRDRLPVAIGILLFAAVGVAYVAWRVPNRAQVLAARGLPPDDAR